jgi:hypothetical protein
VAPAVPVEVPELPEVATPRYAWAIVAPLFSFDSSAFTRSIGTAKPMPELPESHRDDLDDVRLSPLTHKACLQARAPPGRKLGVS